MSSKLERDLDDFLFFNGPMPNLAEGFTEVPLPDGFYACAECGQVSNHYKFGQVCARCEYLSERHEH